MDRAVFLDRDNTLIANDGDLGDPDAVRLLDGVAPALARLRDAGFRLVVVTNQGGVARGAFSEADVEAVNDRIERALAEAAGGRRLIDRSYSCPYHPEGTVQRYRREHPWRKPQPGMLLAAADELGLDLHRSWMIGDQPRDVAAGRAAGCATVLVSREPAAIEAAGGGAVAADLQEAAAIILASGAPAAAPLIPPETAHLLVVCPSWVGDTVMATPVLRAAREALPEARITAACRPGLEPLLDGLPSVNAVVAAPTKPLPAVLRLGRRLRALRPDAALLLPNSFRAALIGILSGAPVRVGWRRGWRRLLLTDAPAPPAGRPVAAVSYYAQLARPAFGLAAIDDRPALAVTEAERAEARRLLDGVPRPFAVLCPGANRPDKRWPAERFAAVADALADEFGVSAVATGAGGEAAVARAVTRAARAPIADLVQRGVTLAALKAVAEEACVMITNDTGPRHVAAALGTPVVALFGPTDARWTTLPAAREVRLLADPFLPEALVADDHPGRCAITKIAVGDVVSGLRRLLGATAPEAPEALRASRAPTSPGT